MPLFHSQSLISSVNPDINYGFGNSSAGFLLISLMTRPYTFVFVSLQVAGALSAIVILFITLWIGVLFEDLPKVKKKALPMHPCLNSYLNTVKEVFGKVFDVFC